MSTAPETLDNAARFLRTFDVPLDPSAEWAVFDEMMGVFRQLRPELGPEGALAAMGHHLGDELAEKGFSLADLQAVGKSAMNGTLHGRVLFAWQAKQEADKAPPAEEHTEAPPSRAPHVEWTFPSPLTEAAYIGPVGELVRVIAPHTEADPAALLLQSLAAFGSIVGRRAYFMAEADRHFPNLFVSIVGATSKGRKGTSAGHVRRCFRMVAEEWATTCNFSGLSSGEGLIWQVRDPIHRKEPVREKGRVVDYQDVQVDEGVSDKRLLVTESEMGQMLRILAREGNSLSGTIRQAWDTGDLNTMVKTNPARATGAHVSMIGHVTSEELVRNLSQVEAANGFANRFLWVCSKRSRLLPEGGCLDGAALVPIADELRRALRSWSGADEVEIERDPEARELWIAVYPELSEGRPGLLGSVTSRAEAQTMRLALAYALTEGARAIGRRHLEAALEVWRYCFESARFIFGTSLGDPVADTIVGALRAAGRNGMTREELSELFGRNRAAGDIERALLKLFSHGMAHRVKEREPGKRGRPPERWFAGPDEGNEGNAGIRPDPGIPSFSSFPSSGKGGAR